MKNFDFIGSVFFISTCLFLHPTFLAGQRTSLDKVKSYRLDHVNIAVENLVAAKNHYSDILGFSIKPGRLHKNGLLNAFTKFKDGTLLELITSSREDDPLSSWYFNFIKKNATGAGAFVAVRIDNEGELKALKNRLSSNGSEYDYVDSSYAKLLSFKEDNLLHPIFFIHYLNPVIDKPIHLNHPNAAQRLIAVWFSDQLAAALKHDLDFKVSTMKIALPFLQTKGTVIQLNNSQIYLLPTQSTNRILGVTLLVEDLDVAKTFIEQKTGTIFEVYKTERGESFAISPELTFGIWIEFLEINK